MHIINIQIMSNLVAVGLVVFSVYRKQTQTFSSIKKDVFVVEKSVLGKLIGKVFINNMQFIFLVVNLKSF